MLAEHDWYEIVGQYCNILLLLWFKSFIGAVVRFTAKFIRVVSLRAFDVVE